MLHRTIGQRQFEVWVPEGIQTYNLFGRSGTDTNDQCRGKLPISTRRVARDGVKGALWGFDILFECAHIIQVDLLGDAADTKERAKLTTVKSKLGWVDDYLATAEPIRRRSSPAQQASAVETKRAARTPPRKRGRPAKEASPAPPQPSPNPPTSQNPSTQAEREHKLVNMGDIGRAAVKRKQGLQKKTIHKKARRCKGSCNYGDCPTPSKTSQLRCMACNGGKGAYYHLDCFFDTHHCFCDSDEEP